MSQSSAEDRCTRLRATATSFIPQATATGRPEAPINKTEDNKPSPSETEDVSKTSETSDNVLLKSHAPTPTSTTTPPCPTCTPLTLTLASLVKTCTNLESRIQRLSNETPIEKLIRLCAERDAQIQVLKQEVEILTKRDEVVRGRISGEEEKLKGLEREILGVRGKEEFTVVVREGKKKTK